MSERIRYAWGSSSLGDFIAAASDDGLVAFEFGEQGTAMLDTLQMRFPDAAIVDDRSGLSDMVGKLEHLVDHPDQDPGIVLDMRGSDYQKQVWTMLREVPAGETTNYGSLAAKLGTSDARDLTEAIGSNAIAILIPCHRVVKKDGSISGYRGVSAESAFCSNASGGPNSSGKPEEMMSDKYAPALDVSVEEQDSFGNFGEDSVQTLLSLALADPECAKERFPAYRLTRLVTARFDMDDTEATIFADLARPLATVRLLHGTAPFNDHLRDAIERFGLMSLFCDNGPGRHHHAIRPTGIGRSHIGAAKNLE